MTEVLEDTLSYLMQPLFPNESSSEMRTRSYNTVLSNLFVKNLSYYWARIVVVRLDQEIAHFKDATQNQTRNSASRPETMEGAHQVHKRT